MYIKIKSFNFPSKQKLISSTKTNKLIKIMIAPASNPSLCWLNICHIFEKCAMCLFIIYVFHSVHYIKITYSIFGYIVVHKYIYLLLHLAHSILYRYIYAIIPHIIYAFMIEMYLETNDTTTLCYKVYQICRISFILCRNRLKTVSRLYLFFK